MQCMKAFGQKSIFWLYGWRKNAQNDPKWLNFGIFEVLLFAKYLFSSKNVHTFHSLLYKLSHIKYIRYKTYFWRKKSTFSFWRLFPLIFHWISYVKKNPPPGGSNHLQMGQFFIFFFFTIFVHRKKRPAEISKKYVFWNTLPYHVIRIGMNCLAKRYFCKSN